MKRVLLITTILALCIFVIIFGNLIFVKSDSVLKYQRNSMNNSGKNNISLSIKAEEDKLNLGMIKEHRPALSGNNQLSSPLGYETDTKHNKNQSSKSISNKNLYQIIRRLKDMLLTKEHR